MTVTLADLTAEISRTRMVRDTDQFILEANEITAVPHTDEDLRRFLSILATRNQMTITLDVKSDLKAFSEFRMEQVCTLYGLSYDPTNPLSQFPEFQCEEEHVDDELLSYLMQELNSRTALTPIAKAPEAHNSIYVYCILHAIAKFSSLNFLVLAERYVEGYKAKGKVDYSVELSEGGILGVTEVKRDDYTLGIAQNAMQIRSALEYNLKHKRGINQRSYFGIATNAHRWYFLQYTPEEIPMISKEYEAMSRGKFSTEAVKEIAGIVMWLLKVGSVTSEPPQKKLKLDKSSLTQVGYLGQGS